MKSTLFSSLTILAGLMVSTGAHASVLADHINDGFSADNGAYWGVDDVGWFYTPASGYDLIGINTEFSIPNLTVVQNRTVTVVLYQGDTPAAGGTLLGSFQFDSSLAEGTLGGGTFASPITLTAGQQYFVGFEDVGPLSSTPNLDDLGVNFTGDSGAAFLSTAQFDTSTCATPHSFGCEDAAHDWLSQPILQFLAPDPIPTSTPDPSTVLLLGSGLAAVALRVRRRRGQA
ncbi:MAG TPA: PEP-CTERM sorting domain-containing protein [Candidatus Sulfopaludibacter sp.]|jgi:hypothetical protein|nr:PEP-CTERM sorting domain-containing protein [Candidatus Sulfopaludibacter sp.]